MSFDQVRFKEMIMKEIGTGSQAEFAKRCGMTPQHLSRLLKEGNEIKPSRTTLQKIAEQTSLSYEELLAVCGHADSPEAVRMGMDMNERAVLNAEDMKAGITAMTKNIRLYRSITDFLDDYSTLYGTEDVRFSIGKKQEYIGDHVPNAEYYCPVIATISTRTQECKTWFILYFCETKSGKYVMLDAAFDGKALMEAGMIDDRAIDQLYEEGKKPEDLPYVYQIKYLAGAKERLLEAIFGGLDDPEYETAIQGFGFELDKCPERFRDFLKAHEKTFCKDTENHALYKKVMEEGEDPEAVFAELENEYTGDSGYGAVIAQIMAEETDLPFVFWEDHDKKNRCVIVDYDEIDKRSINESEVKRAAYRYAKELGLKEYGECISRQLVTLEMRNRYKIEEED